MNIPYLTTYQDTAAALYLQREQQQQTALADAGLMARHEQLMRTHLHVLSRCAPLEKSPEKEAEFFVDLAARLLAPSATVRQEGRELALSLLLDPGAGREGAFKALSLLLPPDDDAGLTDLYRQNKDLRPLLFDLWREQSHPVPAGLLSVAELRGHDTRLQIAALRYAAGRPEIGLDLFSVYYQGLLSGAPRPDQSGHLLATALWGGLLRGERRLAKPLWRCIESETDPDDLYHLLRLAALMALPEAIALLVHHAEQHPEAAAELLALHGTAPALQALMDLSRGEVAPGVVDAWQWVSGKRLVSGPRLQLVPAEGQSAPEPDPDTLQGWWQQHTPLEDGQRLLMGDLMSTDHLIRQCQSRAGRFSRNLLDLLAYTIGTPLGVTAEALQQQRRDVLKEKTANS